MTTLIVAANYEQALERARDLRLPRAAAVRDRRDLLGRTATDLTIVVTGTFYANPAHGEIIEEIQRLEALGATVR